MASIEEMSVAELKEFIDKIPRKSACDRANAEKLEMYLQDKIHKERALASINQPIPISN